MAAIYDRFGMTWSAEAQAEVTLIDEESKHGKTKPSHVYTLADYGLTEDQVRAAFS